MVNSKEDEAYIDDGIHYKGDTGPIIGVRHVQLLMMAFSTAFGYALKSGLSVTIVAMTNSTSSPNPDVPTYHWTNTSVILSAILWSGISVNLLAGYLGKQYGPKWFIFGSSILNSISFMLIPVSAASGGSTGVIICRLFEGLAIGFLFPLNGAIMGRWVPPESRSRMGFLVSTATTCVTMSCSVATGYIAQSHLGWPYVFYILGTCSLIWAILYAFIGEQSFNTARCISSAEKKYLATTLFNPHGSLPVPWKKILSSIHFWAILAGQMGGDWVVVMHATEMSQFLAHVMKYDLKSNGTLSALPNLIGILPGLGFSILSDLIPKRGILSIVNSRRVFHITGHVMGSLSLILMTCVPVEHRAWAVVLLCFSHIFRVCWVVGGSATNMLDVSPKYAGIMSGIIQMFSQCVSLFAPLLVQWICTDLTDTTQWRTVFLISGVISLATSAFFGIFATGKRQVWDSEEAAQNAAMKRDSIVSGKMSCKSQI